MVKNIKVDFNIKLAIFCSNEIFFKRVTNLILCLFFENNFIKCH